MTLQNATFLAIFLHFVRKIVDKVRVEKYSDIPFYAVDCSGEYVVMVHEGGVYWSRRKSNARLVAAAIMEAAPEIRDRVFILESEEVETDVDNLLPYCDIGVWQHIRQVIDDVG